jgi:hypothetical protein
MSRKVVASITVALTALVPAGGADSRSNTADRVRATSLTHIPWLTDSLSLVTPLSYGPQRGTQRSSRSVRFLDSTGEEPTAPDITYVAVSNDDAGNITFWIGISNRPALTEDMFLVISLDTDQNSITGDPQTLGTDYVIQLIHGTLGLFQWNGSDFTVAFSQASLTYSYTTVGAMIRISANDLGKTKAFNFGTLAASGLAIDASGNRDFTNVHVDAAPDAGRGFWSYQVEISLPPPPPPSSPPPPPKTFRSAATLPSEIRYRGKSIKHVPITEKVYATMKFLGVPHLLAVACWSENDWPSVLESTGGGANEPDTVTLAFWLRIQPRWLHLSAKTCSDLQRLIDTRIPNGQRAYALTTVLHETTHAYGVRSEAQANCYGVQLVYVFARQLNFQTVRALRLEQLAVRKTRAVAPRGYWDASRCRDGGTWDLDPSRRNLSY